MKYFLIFVLITVSASAEDFSNIKIGKPLKKDIVMSLITDFFYKGAGQLNCSPKKVPNEVSSLYEGYEHYINTWRAWKAFSDKNPEESIEGFEPGSTDKIIYKGFRFIDSPYYLVFHAQFDHQTKRISSMNYEVYDQIQFKNLNSDLMNSNYIPVSGKLKTKGVCTL